MIYRRLLEQYSEIQHLRKAFHIAESNQPMKLLNQIRSFKSEKFKGKTIIIGGAGLAGLCSAYELTRLGFKVILLEAQKNHIGGRARTLRISKDVYGELGAMRIPEKHALTRHYIAEFKLKLRKFVQANEKGFCFVRGKSFRVNEVENIKELYNLEPEEKLENTLKYWEKTIINIVKSLNQQQRKELFQEEITDPFLRLLDHKSLYEVFRESSLSKEAVEMLVSTWNLETSLQISLLEHLREEIEEVWAGNFDEIEGGTDLLAKSFYDQISGCVQQNAVITEVEQHLDFVRVCYRNDIGQTIWVEGNWFICTLPLGVLQKVSFKPELSFAKSRAIRRVNYDSSTKILAKVKRRFWEVNDGIYGGGSVWDNILGSTWYPSDNTKMDKKVSNSESMFLASYTWGQTARRIDEVPLKFLRQFMVGQLSNIHSSLLDNPNDIERLIRWSWTSFEWSNGAYAFFMPDEHTDLYKDLVKPEGRILLAGEHASLTHSWMQGALESALRASEHIAMHYQN